VSPRRVSLGLVLAALVLVGTAWGLVVRLENRTNKVALAAEAKKVSFVHATAETYRPTRSYVGTLRPWVEANVAPQLVSAYVETVLVRPGAVVKRGDVMATLDCRNASTAHAVVTMQGRAIEARQKAIADEADRTSRLLDGGYASQNEAEQALAQSASELAELESQRAQIAHGSLEVGDCVLRAPFDGEVGDRFVDPGVYVRPGTAIVSVVDRSTARFVADVPEVDFAVVAPKTKVRIHVDATGQDFDGVIARRAPHADPEVRTIHFEVDVPNASREMPVDTTAEIRIEFGKPSPATEVPLYAATVRGSRASVYVLEGERARLRVVNVLDESGGELLVDTSLAPGASVVTEGRALLSDGDIVVGKEEPKMASASLPSTPQGKR
jgi:membrane fusion protein, multidrug efflux system